MRRALLLALHGSLLFLILLLAFLLSLNVTGRQLYLGPEAIRPQYCLGCGSAAASTDFRTLVTGQQNARSGRARLSINKYMTLNLHSDSACMLNRMLACHDPPEC